MDRLFDPVVMPFLPFYEIGYTRVQGSVHIDRFIVKH